MRWKKSPLGNPPALTATSLHLWRANLNLPTPQLQALERILSTDELIRARRFKFLKHQQHFIAARGMLRQLLGRYLQQAPTEILFHYNEHGKPQLTQTPSLHFSVSHSHDWVTYAIGLQPLLGVDIERIHDIAVTDIAQRFFSHTENQQLHHLALSEQRSAFFKLWTCKEAFIKAIGEGMTFPLQNFTIDILANPPHLVNIRDDATAAQSWTLQQFIPADDYIGAVAVKGAVTEWHWWQDDCH